MFDEDSNSTKKSNSKTKNIVKIELIVFLVVIVVFSVIVAFSSTVKKNAIPEENTKLNTALDNEKANQEKRYDFLDNENSTFKFTEKEAIEKLTKMMNHNINSYEKSRGKDGKTIIYTMVDSAGILSISIKSSDINNKVTDINIHFVTNSYLSDEVLQKMVNNATGFINVLILQIDVDRAMSNDLSQSEIDKAQELADLALKEEAINISIDYGGEGKVSSMNVKYNVIQ